MGIVSTAPGPAADSPTGVPESLREFLGKGPARPEGAIEKVSYTHDAMIDLIIAQPWISQGGIAKHFGYTQGWVSQVFAADAFQHRLAERKAEIVDPALRATIEEKFKALVNQSFTVLMQKLEADPSKVSDELALRAIEISSKALGYGARDQKLSITQSFVVQLPEKAATVEDWTAKHAPLPARQPLVLDAIVTARCEEAQANAEEPSSTVPVAPAKPAEPAAPGPSS